MCTIIANLAYVHESAKTVCAQNVRITSMALLFIFFPFQVLRFYIIVGYIIIIRQEMRKIKLIVHNKAFTLI